MRIINELNGFFRTFQYRSPRLHTRFPFWLQTDTLPMLFVPAVCTDISDNGIGAELDRQLETGSIVTLVLPTASRPEPFMIRARVASRQAQRHGFVFFPEGPEEVREIAAAVRAFAGSHCQADGVSGQAEGGAERKVV